MRLRKKLNTFGFVCFLVGFVLAVAGYIAGSNTIGTILIILGGGLTVISVPFAVIVGIIEYKRHRIKNRKKCSPYRPTEFVPKREMTPITELEGYEKPADKAEPKGQREAKSEKAPLKDITYQTYAIYQKGERRYNKKKKSK